METVRNQTFDNRRIPIDGVRFENCVFSDTKLIYRAAAEVEFDGCTFGSCEWVFEDAALRTLQLLAALFDGLGIEGQHLVRAVFAAVEEGQLGEMLFHPTVASAA